MNTKTMFFLPLEVAAFAIVSYRGLAQTSPPVFNVSSSNYNASGSSNYGNCSGQAGSKLLTNCTVNSSNDFSVGQGIHIVGVGVAPRTAQVYGKPIVTQNSNGAGTHQYCYVVASADPFQGISAPSQSSCTANNLPDPLSYNTVFNTLNVPNKPDGTPGADVGPLPSLLWYVSEDGGNYQLLSVASINSGAQGYATAYALDTGQRAGGAGDNRGGWPDNLPFNTAQWPTALNASSQNPPLRNEEFFTTITGISGNQVGIADPLAQTFSGAVVVHDDTAAVQKAINDASAAGGGIVQLNAGYYRIQRPSFKVNNSSYPTYPTYSTDISGVPYSEVYSYLQLPNGSSGNVTIQGVGNSTFILANPDSGGRSHFIDIGSFGRPSYMGLPAYPGNVIKMQPVAKGATVVSLLSVPTNPTLKAGDDVWLYSGSYSSGQTCNDYNGTPGGDCHFSELNSVASIQGTTVTLVYPTSKKYYQDQYGNSFGLVKMPVTPHNVSLKSFQMDSYNPILSTGLVYGLLIDSLTLLKPASHGQLGGGFKRNMTVQNSTWYLGAGDVSDAETDEFDQFTNVLMQSNNIHGYGAVGGEGPSLSPRIRGTEGSSQFTIKNNNFYDAEFLMDQTTDDVITGNQFQNGFLAVGSEFAPVGNCIQNGPDGGFVSFGSQAAVDVENNTFTSNRSYIAPAFIRTGSFDTATIAGNTITYSSPQGGNGPPFAIVAGSGTVSKNTISFSTGIPNSYSVCLTPNAQPAEKIVVQGNTLQGVNGAPAVVGAGIYIPDPQFTDPASITLQGNTFNITAGNNCRVVAQSSTPVTCQ